jgi:DNA-binding GntR family transcriptional regulator
MVIKSITDSVVEYLRSKIITGELVAGQRLNVADIIAQLDISVPPLREALRVLENDHLVVSIPRKGAYVSDISIAELQKLLQAREMLECYSIRLLKEKDIRQLPDIESALSIIPSVSMPAQDNPEELLDYFKVHLNFHIKLVESTGNEWMISCYNSVYYQLARYQLIHLYVPGKKQRIKEHYEILELIRASSFDQAEEKLRLHIRNTYKNLKAKILKNEIKKDKQTQKLKPDSAL